MPVIKNSGKPVAGHADRVCVRNSIVLDVLHRPASAANLAADHVEVVVYGAARVVAHPAHRKSPFIVLAATMHPGSDMFGVAR
jgi:hypothetical protein